MPLEPYNLFDCKSLDATLNRIYGSSNAQSLVLRSMRDREYHDLLACIEEYVAIAKEQLVLGNRLRAFRMYIVINQLIDNRVF